MRKLIEKGIQWKEAYSQILTDSTTDIESWGCRHSLMVQNTSCYVHCGMTSAWDIRFYDIKHDNTLRFFSRSLKINDFMVEMYFNKNVEMEQVSG